MSQKWVIFGSKMPKMAFWMPRVWPGDHGNAGLKKGHFWLLSQTLFQKFSWLSAAPSEMKFSSPGSVIFEPKMTPKIQKRYSPEQIGKNFVLKIFQFWGQNWPICSGECLFSFLGAFLAVFGHFWLKKVETYGHGKLTVDPYDLLSTEVTSAPQNGHFWPKTIKKVDPRPLFKKSDRESVLFLKSRPRPLFKKPRFEKSWFFKSRSVGTQIYENYENYKNWKMEK